MNVNDFEGINSIKAGIRNVRDNFEDGMFNQNEFVEHPIRRKKKRHQQNKQFASTISLCDGYDVEDLNFCCLFVSQRKGPVGVTVRQIKPEIQHDDSLFFFFMHRMLLIYIPVKISIRTHRNSDSSNRNGICVNFRIGIHIVLY